jgi:hypothetical protein
VRYRMHMSANAEGLGLGFRVADREQKVLEISV